MTVTVSLYTTDATRVPVILGIGIASTVLGVGSVLLRFIVRLNSRGGLWWDDWFILIGMICAVINFVAIAFELQYGLGRHIYDLPKDIDHEAPLKILIAIEESYLLGWGFVKMAMCFFLLRLFNHLRVPIYFIMAFVVSSTIAVVVADALQCIPLNKFWDPTVQGSCFNTPEFSKYAGVVNIISDIVLYLLPMKTLWQLNMPLRKKMGLIALFGVGFFVVLTGFLRLKSLETSGRSDDPTWNNVLCNLWSLAEINIAIFVTSAPALKPVYDFVIGKRRKDSTAVSSGYSSNKNTQNSSSLGGTTQATTVSGTWKSKLGNLCCSKETYARSSVADHEMIDLEDKDSSLGPTIGSTVHLNTRQIQGSGHKVSLSTSTLRAMGCDTIKSTSSYNCDIYGPEGPRTPKGPGSRRPSSRSVVLRSSEVDKRDSGEVFEDQKVILKTVDVEVTRDNE